MMNILFFNSMWKTDKVRAKGFGRGGKQINKFVLYGAKPYIDLWMKERKARGINSEWLFVTCSINKNTKERIYRQRKDTSSWIDMAEGILGGMCTSTVLDITCVHVCID